MSFSWKSRHTVLSILFFASIVSFMDRVAMPVAIPYIASEFHLSSVASGLVMSAFAASYSFSQIPGGILSDRWGVRRVATVALLWWSTFTALTGAAANLAQMVIARLLFGLGEGVFPACLFKSIAVWFPKKERATANAIRLASSPLGASFTPLIVVGVMSLWGWRTVFYLLFIPGAVSALLFWLFVPDQPSQGRFISTAEIAEISDVAETAASDRGAASESRPSTRQTLRAVFAEPHVVRYVCLLFSTDLAYWGFASWLPTYLVKARDFSMSQMGVAASLPYVAGFLGTVLGGWSSEKYCSRDRRIPIACSQVAAAVFLYLIFDAHSVTALVACLTIEGLCINFIISAFWAVPMNTVPRELMGVASGIINMGGQVAAFLSPILIGYLVGAANGRYQQAFIFLIASLLVSCAIAFSLPKPPRDVSTR